MINKEQIICEISSKKSLQLPEGFMANSVSILRRPCMMAAFRCWKSLTIRAIASLFRIRQIHFEH